MSDQFLTKDLHLAALLYAKAVPFVTVNRSGKLCWFVFDDKNLCLQLQQEFFAKSVETHNTNCTQRKYIREEKVEEQVMDYLDTFKIDNPRLLEWVRKALKESHKDETDFHESTIKDLDEQYLKVKNRLDVLYDDKVDGLISKEQYENKMHQYEGQLNDIVDAKQKHNKANINYLKLGMNLFELAQKGRELYENRASISEKKELLNFVFSNLKINGEKVVPTPHNGFEVIALRAKNQNWLPDMDSNHDERIQSPLSYH